MLLRLRVELPDRPGSLGQVARTIGVAGADIVALTVLERSGGRAVDDVTVMWPASAPVDRILAGLNAVPGVRLDGVWRSTELPEPNGREVALLGQIAANPAHGLAILVDAAAGIFAGNWAVAVGVGEDWAEGGSPELVYAGWGAPDTLRLPDLAPLRPRAVTAVDGTHLAAAPLRKAGLVLVVGRVADPAEPQLIPSPFHRSEVERLAQLTEATAVVLGEQLSGLAATAG